MFAKSSLFVFLAVALSAASVLASAAAGPNADAQVGRRFESDTPDYVSGSQSEELPHCSSRIINVRGVKKVLRNNSHECQKAAEEAAADRVPEDNFEDTEETEDTQPLLEFDDDEEQEQEQENEHEEDEVEESDVGSGNESQVGDTGYDSYEDEDEDAYGPGRDQNI